MSELVIGVCIGSLILSFVALVCAILAIAYVVGLKNSTHQVQILDPNAATGDALAKEFAQMEKKMQEGFDHV